MVFLSQINKNAQKMSARCSQYICVCCLTQELPLLKLISCKHLSLLIGIPDFAIKNRIKHVCVPCHHMLMKFKRFRDIVTKNVEYLTRTHSLFDIDQHNQNKFMNMKFTRIILDSVDSVEPLDPIQIEVTPDIKHIKEEIPEPSDNEEDNGTDKLIDETLNKERNLEEESDDDMEESLLDLLNKEKGFDKILENIKKETQTERVGSELLPTPYVIERNQQNKLEIVICPTSIIKNEHCQEKKMNENFTITNANQSPVYNKKVTAKKSSTPNEASSSSTQKDVLLVPDYEGRINEISLTEEELNQEREKERQNPDKYMNMEYKCDDCVLGFNYKETYNDHINTKHTMKPGCMVCKICKTVFLKEGIWKKHVSRHYRRFECQRCFHRTKCENSAVKHYNDVHEKIALETEYECKKCDFKTTVHRTYRYHLALHRREGREPECHICHKYFATHTTLRAHMVTVHEDRSKKIQCDKCPKSFTHKWRLRIHEKNVHGLVKKMPAYCADCNRNFSCETALKVHYVSHKNHVAGLEKKFICDYCGLRYPTKALVRDHIYRKHFFPHPFPKCEICGKELSTKKAMVRHVDRVHHRKPDPKDKICDYCGKGFSTNTYLLVHVRSHTGERPLACDVCGDTFAHPASMRTHKKLKHGPKRKKI